MIIGVVGDRPEAFRGWIVGNAGKSAELGFSNRHLVRQRGASEEAQCLGMTCREAAHEKDDGDDTTDVGVERFQSAFKTARNISRNREVL